MCRQILEPIKQQWYYPAQQHKIASNKKKTYIGVTYTKGLSESFENVCGRHGIKVFLEDKNIKTSWWLPKTKILLPKREGWYTDSSTTGWNVMTNISKNPQHFGRGSKNTQRPPPNITGHTTTTDNFSIVKREDQYLTRTTKESIYIKVNNPSLNKNIGKYHLPHTWGEVLLNTLRTQNNHPYNSGHSITKGSTKSNSTSLVCIVKRNIACTT